MIKIKFIDELYLLNSSNEDFKICTLVELAVEREFDWSCDKFNWNWKSTADIYNRLNINSTSSLKTSMFKYGAEYKKLVKEEDILRHYT